MVDYDVVSNTLVRQNPDARVLHIVLADDPGDQLGDVMSELLAIEAQGDINYVELYIFLNYQAVEWGGWIAHVVLNDKGNLTIDTNNDPGLRRAVYEAFR